MEENIGSIKPLLKSFFQNFVALESKKKNISREYKIVLKILWSDFEKIADKNKIARRIFILEQIEKYLVNKDYHTYIDSVKLPNQGKFIESQGLSTPTIKIKSIDISNFRGFRVNNDNKGRKIVFDDKVSLIFAPNGGGKTSLCEALEWALTGDTQEHKQRGVETADKYFQNKDVAEPSYKNTKLLLEPEDVAIPDTIFDRCFLEKNRIEKFAKFATQPTKDVQEVFGELFGLSEIVNFFKEFGQDLSPTEYEKNNRQNWQTWLDWDIKKRDLEKFIVEAKSEEKAVNDELLKLLNGKKLVDKTTEVETKAKTLERELELLGEDRSKRFSATTFQNNVNLLKDQITKWKKEKDEISKYASDLDFENLYQAANRVFSSGITIEKCPLCDTPLKAGDDKREHVCVVTDPRDKTKTELKKLENLTNKKRIKNEIEHHIKSQILPTIKDEWDHISHNTADENWKFISNSTKPKLPSIDFSSIEALVYGDVNILFDKCMLVFAQDFSNLNIVEKVVNEYRTKRQQTQSQKENIQKEIAQLKTFESQLREANSNLSKKTAIREANEARLKQVLSQSEISILFKKILSEYDKYYNSLQNFQSKVILKESQDIDKFVTGFYRALNLNDHSSELVKEITFPKQPQEDFCLYYENSGQQVCNALQMLSEGHLKTLGLASLLARSAKLKTSLLVFDDAINAIDSDHRDNIANLISGKFSDEQFKFAFGDKWNLIKKYINSCQFVISSHDRFFDEKLANLIIKNHQIRYVLYCSINGIDFCEKGIPANFEKKIETYLNPNTQDIRSAIFYSRIWLEELLLSIATNFRTPTTNKLIEFSNTIDKRTRSVRNPELVTLMDSIISNLKKDGVSADYKKIASILDQIKLEKEGKYVWFFEILNQESHYRRFDHVDISNAPTSNEVETVYKSIQAIHKLIKTN